MWRYKNMTKCPHCNNDLKVIEGSVKFAVQLGEDKKEETACEMPDFANSEEGE